MDYSKLKIGMENFKLVPKAKAQNSNQKEHAQKEEKKGSDHSRTVTEEDSAEEIKHKTNLIKAKSEIIEAENSINQAKPHNTKSNMKAKDFKSTKPLKKQEPLAQVVLTPELWQHVGDQVQDHEINSKQQRSGNKSQTLHSNSKNQQLDTREPDKNLNNSNMIPTKSNNTAESTSQSQQSNQFNLMSALREENFITSKSLGNVFSAPGQEQDCDQNKFTSSQLQSKVQEAIPELARANHGFQMIAPQNYAQASSASNKSGFVFNDVFNAQNISTRASNINQPFSESDVIFNTQQDLPNLYNQQQNAQTLHVNLTNSGTFPNVKQQPINPNQGEIVFPFVITKLLDSKESQMQFIIDQLEEKRIKNEKQLTNKQAEIEALNIQIMTLNEEKREASSFCKALYEQSIIYYNNFKALENEYINTCRLSQDQIGGSKKIIDKITDIISIKGSGNKFYKHNNDQIREQLDDLKKKLFELETTITKSRCNIDEKKECGSEEEQLQIMHQNQYQQHSLKKVQTVENSFQQNLPQQSLLSEQASQKEIDQNLLIEMERLFESENDRSPLLKSVSQIQNKLDEEIKQFKSGVADIMLEMQPVKNQIIQKISQLIQKSVPDGDVRVYGSHATQLCLHWSDIDLVLIPPDCKHMVPMENNSFNDFKQNSYSDFNGKNQMSAMNQTGVLMYQSKNWLATVFQELLREEQAGSNWITSLKFIETTAVPVIKLKCNYIPLRKEKEPEDELRLPDGSKSKYQEIIKRPINIDITLMTEHHNGINCVNLVKQYLKENQVIEPLILVLKQMLKVWGFNEPYNGGLSSYALFLMIVSFLQAKKKPREIAFVNLGETLLEFMKYYSDLESTSNAIACALPGEEIGETRNLYPVPDIGQSYAFFPQPQIHIDDPLNQNNNVGKSSYQFQQIKNILGMSYNQAFTGCFCRCHFYEKISDNKGLLNQVTINNYYGSLLQQSVAQLNYAQRICNMENYPQYQQPPEEFSELNKKYFEQSLLGNALPPQNDDKQGKIKISDREENQDGAQLLHTQSQPFRIEQSQMQPNGEKCSCESILSRLIYGYKQYQIITQQQNQRGPNESSNPALSMNYIRQSRHHDPFMSILQMPMSNIYSDIQDF